MNAIRRALFWWLCGIADQVSDIAFSRPGMRWRKNWVSLANAIDRVAARVMTNKMRREPAKGVPHNGA